MHLGRPCPTTPGRSRQAQQLLTGKSFNLPQYLLIATLPSAHLGTHAKVNPAQQVCCRISPPAPSRPVPRAGGQAPPRPIRDKLQAGQRLPVPSGSPAAGTPLPWEMGRAALAARRGLPPHSVPPAQQGPEQGASASRLEEQQGASSALFLCNQHELLHSQSPAGSQGNAAAGTGIRGDETPVSSNAADGHCRGVWGSL